MLFGSIISALISILIGALIFSVILQLACKVVIKDTIEFGDAYKSAIVACAILVLGDYALLEMFDGTAYIVARLVSAFLVWALVLMIVVGLEVVQSLLIALVFMGITYAVIFLFGLFLSAGAAVGASG
jgi:hypothetical protein